MHRPDVTQQDMKLNASPVTLAFGRAGIKARNYAWEDGSVGKVLVEPGWGLEFNSQPP